MGDVYTKAREVQAKTTRDTLHDVEAVVCAYTLGDRLLEVKSYTRSAKLAGEKTGTLDEMRR